MAKYADSADCVDWQAAESAQIREIRDACHCGSYYASAFRVEAAVGGLLLGSAVHRLLGGADRAEHVDRFAGLAE